jgi:CheY-like chemotaxis protein
LGLTITRKLLNLMDSDIQVESTPGLGSRFYFTLSMPYGEKQQVDDSKPVDITAMLKDRKVRVLLVEDNEVNQLVAMNFLKNWGIEGVIANNGREAVQLVQRKGFDLILMDLQMPEMNGYEATKVIRGMNEDYYQKIPIIALTASAMVEMRDKVIALGMTDYVTKPFHPSDLQRIIAKHVMREGT